MADLTEFYPGGTQTSPRGDGAAASPATAVAGSSTAAIGGAPALWVLALVGVSLLLMHKG